MDKTVHNRVLHFLLNDMTGKTIPQQKPTPRNVWYYCSAFAKNQLETYNNTQAKLVRAAFINKDNPHRMFTRKPPLKAANPDEYLKWKEENLAVIQPPVR
jgi:hypothetical protein